jgi:hypothetical protein
LAGRFDVLTFLGVVDDTLLVGQFGAAEWGMQMRSVQQDKHGLGSYVLRLGGSGRIDTTRAATKVSGKGTARSLRGVREGGQVRQTHHPQLCPA